LEQFCLNSSGYLLKYLTQLNTVLLLPISTQTGGKLNQTRFCENVGEQEGVKADLKRHSSW
jgi:hypothetical protein